MTIALAHAWDALPPSLRAALDRQWIGLTMGGLPCGAAIIDARGTVVAHGHNRACTVAAHAPLPLRRAARHRDTRPGSGRRPPPG